MKESEKEAFYIPCIGIDEKKHVCLPWEEKTKCGVKVKSKSKTDIEHHHKMNKYSCYECTY